MRTVPALVLILIGVAVGSLIRSVHAQTDVVLFQVGQRLTLSYDDEHSIDCTLLEIRGPFVRCEQAKPDAFARSPTYVTWRTSPPLGPSRSASHSGSGDLARYDRHACRRGQRRQPRALVVVVSNRSR